MFIEARVALLAVRSIRMLKFLHWYLNKAANLTMYLFGGLVEGTLKDYIDYQLGSALLFGMCCLIVVFMVGGTAVASRYNSTEEARAGLWAIVFLSISPLFGTLLPIITIIGLIWFIVRLVATAFELDLRDVLSLSKLSDLYYEVRSRYLEFKSKMKTRIPIKKEDCAYRNNYCPACSREYNK